MAVYGGDALLGDLMRRRSADARRLQTAQAAMGVPGQLPTRAPAGPAPVEEPGGDLAAQLAAARQGTSVPTPGAQRPSGLQALLGQRQAQAEGIQARSQDLAIADRLLKITDSRLPKAARQFLIKGLTRELGIDPRSETSRDIARLVTSLDPDSLGALRRSVASQSDTAQPGALTEMARGILSGQVPVEQVITSVAAGPPADGRMGLGGPTEVAQADTTAAPTPGVARYRETTTPPRLREIAPELSAVLGYDPAQRMRNIDVINRSHPNIPSDYEGQQKLATDISISRQNAVRAISLATRMEQLFRGKPEVLSGGPEIGIPGTGTRIPLAPNIPSIAEGMREYLNQFGRSVWGGDVFNRSRPADLNLTPPADAPEPNERMKFVSREAAKMLAARLPEGVLSNEDAAKTHRVIQQMLYDLAYARAKQKDPGGRLSNQDIELELRGIGRSASPEVFSRALQNVVDQAVGDYDNLVRNRTGGPPLRGGITLEHFNQQDQDVLRISPILSPGSRAYLGVVEAMDDPTAQLPPRTTGDVPVRRVPTETITPAGPRTPIEGQPLPPMPGPRGVGGIPTIEAEEAAAVGREREDRAAVLAERERAGRRLELAESSEARAARAEQRQITEARRVRIQAAFAEIGKALSAGGGGTISAGGAGGGGDQDPAAFRLTPPPQRRAPTPVDASRYQRR